MPPKCPQLGKTRQVMVSVKLRETYPRMPIQTLSAQTKCIKSFRVRCKESLRCITTSLYLHKRRYRVLSMRTRRKWLQWRNPRVRNKALCRDSIKAHPILQWWLPAHPTGTIKNLNNSAVCAQIVLRQAATQIHESSLRIQTKIRFNHSSCCQLRQSTSFRSLARTRAHLMESDLKLVQPLILLVSLRERQLVCQDLSIFKWLKVTHRIPTNLNSKMEQLQKCHRKVKITRQFFNIMESKLSTLKMKSRIKRIAIPTP